MISHRISEQVRARFLLELLGRGIWRPNCRHTSWKSWNLNLTHKPLLLLLGFVITLPFGEAQSIQVPARVEASNDTLTLGEIARIQPSGSWLEGIPVGYAPDIGQHRWLKRGDLEHFLKKSGLNMEAVQVTMPSDLLITRKSQLVESDRIREAVEDMLQDRFPGIEATIVRLEVPQSIVLPEGAYRIDVEEPSRSASLNNLTLKLSFFVDGSHRQSNWVRAGLRARAPVVTVRENLPYGHSLSRSDLQIDDRELRRLEGFLGSLDQVEGFVTRRALRAGQPLSQRDLKRPQLVKRGDIVTIMVRGKTFSVSTLGRARDAGFKGELIEVENLDSRQSLRATVVADKRVLVPIMERY